MFGFQHYLGDQHDVWSAPGVQAAGNTVQFTQIKANIATANVYGNTIRDSGVCNGA